jgi:hypothetical protein
LRREAFRFCEQRIRNRNRRSHATAVLRGRYGGRCMNIRANPAPKRRLRHVLTGVPLMRIVASSPSISRVPFP